MAARLVALHLPPELFPDALLSAWEDGDAVLPLPWGEPRGVVERTISALRPSHVVEASDPRRTVALPAASSSSTSGTDTSTVPDELPPDTALVVATSGSTGPPKGVVLTHRAVASSTAASLQRLGARQGERFTLALPLHHVAGIQILLRSRACGTDAELLRETGPTAIAAATGDHLSLVATQLGRLVDAGVDLRRWSSILVGGGRVEASLLDAARTAGARLVTSYGMTETVGGCVYDGRALDGVEVAVRHDGRVRLRGPMLFSGYLGDPDATAATFDDEGWFLTGDRGTLRGGHLQVLGRADDVIISGGENVPGELVTELLRGHPGVCDVAVVGVADPEWGEAVVAIVVARDPADPPTLQQLRDRVRARAPSAYAPRRLVLVEELPRNRMGKLAGERLRSMVVPSGGQPTG